MDYEKMWNAAILGINLHANIARNEDYLEGLMTARWIMTSLMRSEEEEEAENKESEK